MEEDDHGTARLNVLKPESQLCDCQPPSFSVLSVWSSFVRPEHLTITKHRIEDSFVAKFFGQKILSVWVIFWDIFNAQVRSKQGHVQEPDLNVAACRKKNLVSTICDW
jgi:hypothetical protein